MEKTDEAYGIGNEYSTECRQFDSRLGRWMSIDPLFRNFPWQSPYVAFDNNPITNTDPNGMASKPSTHKVKKGETLSAIAKKNNIKIEDLKSANKQIDWNSKNRTGKKQDWVYAGETINIPGEVETNEKTEKKSTDNDKDEAGYNAPPRSLPGFPDSQKVKPKNFRTRWRLPDGDLLEWDGQHGELERYNPKGKHKGVYSPEGDRIGDAVPGRKIEPMLRIPDLSPWVAPFIIVPVTMGYIILRSAERSLRVITPIIIDPKITNPDYSKPHPGS